MANINQPNVRVQVLITADTELGRYQDAIYFTKAEFDALSDAQVSNLQNQRVDKWVSDTKTASANTYVVTKADLQNEKASLEAQILVLSAKIALK